MNLNNKGLEINKYAENMLALKKMWSVFGTRPEAIKMSPVIKKICRE
jgi:hypothetical protein